MPIIIRESDDPYKWSIGEVALKDVANQEKKMPREYITADGFAITDECARYLAPLIQGENYPPFKNGIPDYTKLKNTLIDKKLINYELP